MKCPVWDQICRQVLIDNIPVQECQCKICDEEERVCTVEAIDGVEQDVCRCPDPTSPECTFEEQVCFKDDDQEEIICICQDNSCDQQSKTCSNKMTTEGQQVLVCLCQDEDLEITEELENSTENSSFEVDLSKLEGSKAFVQYNLD